MYTNDFEAFAGVQQKFARDWIFLATGLILNELDCLRDVGRFIWLITHYVKRL